MNLNCLQLSDVPSKLFGFPCQRVPNTPSPHTVNDRVSASVARCSACAAVARASRTSLCIAVTNCCSACRLSSADMITESCHNSQRSIASKVLEGCPVSADFHLRLPSSRCSQEGRGNPTSVANILLRQHVNIIEMLVNRTRGYVTAGVMQAAL